MQKPPNQVSSEVKISQAAIRLAIRVKKASSAERVQWRLKDSEKKWEKSWNKRSSNLDTLDKYMNINYV